MYFIFLYNIVGNITEIKLNNLMLNKISLKEIEINCVNRCIILNPIFTYAFKFFTAGK